MKIKKSNKEYTIKERKSFWSIALSSESLSVDYQVSKELCKTEAELREYIQKEKMF